jgi:chemotaxis protein methyltransferase CheR
MIDIPDKEFIQLVEYVKSNYGINLTHKRTLVVGRLQNYLTQKGIKSFTEYYKLLISDTSGNSASELVNKLTTNHTFFAREVQHFDFFKDKALPDLVKQCEKNRDLRIWSAGCSSGEEPYTLAMLIADYFGENRAMWDTKVLATDISTKVLNIAKAGIYQNEQLDSLPENWRRNYFKKLDKEKSSVADNIKSEVVFRIFNLMNEAFPFKKKFHVIFCRNVMIYFDSNTKTELVNKFYENTEHGGYLFIGHSESINREESRYKYVMPAVYRKE